MKATRLAHVSANRLVCVKIAMTYAVDTERIGRRRLWNRD
jgi:hypothetical protein